MSGVPAGLTPLPRSPLSGSADASPPPAAAVTGGSVPAATVPRLHPRALAQSGTRTVSPEIPAAHAEVGAAAPREADLDLQRQVLSPHQARRTAPSTALTGVTA